MGFLFMLAGVVILVFIFFALRALIAGFNIGRFERIERLAAPQPATWLLRLNLFEPAITFSLLLLSIALQSNYGYPLMLEPTFFAPLQLPILSAVSMGGLLIILPLGWSLSRNHTTRKISHQLLLIGMLRVFWIFVIKNVGLISIIAMGVTTATGIVILALSIRSVRRLALAHTISTGIKEFQHSSLHTQPITMGRQGLMVGSSPYERRDYDAEHILRKRD